jgi:rod shape-determining protein MreD
MARIFHREAEVIEFTLLIVLTYVAAAAETTIGPTLAIDGVAPRLVALVVVAAAVWMPRSVWRIPQVAAIGLLFDFHSLGHAGVGMGAFAVLTFALLELRAWLRRTGPIAQTVLTAASVTFLLLFIALSNLALGHGLPGGAIFWRAALGGMYTGAMSLPVWMILDWRRGARLGRFGMAAR